MNEIEYDIIDELYFVSSYGEIAQALNLSDEELSTHLAALIKKGYVKALYPDPDTEVVFDEAQFGIQYHQYFYLATKAGLISHNSR
jgi:DNA-binding transcriptional ArsR family regulator